MHQIRTFPTLVGSRFLFQEQADQEEEEGPRPPPFPPPREEDMAQPVGIGGDYGLSAGILTHTATFQDSRSSGYDIPTIVGFGMISPYFFSKSQLTM